MANIIEKADRPVLVISHNKTLAAQLYQEFRRFFPRNAVEYFVSYYDYYQPEAFIPASNTYIAKEATINDEIDRLRLCATNSLFSRRDVIIVASVSCIYGIGAPETYYAMSFPLDGRRRPRPQGPPGQARVRPVRARRGRVQARHIPRPRRHRRGLPELRGLGLPHRARGRPDQGHLGGRSAPRPRPRGARHGHGPPAHVLLHPRGDRPRRPSPGSRPSSPSRSPTSGAAARPSRPSASRSGPSTTWRCCASSATAPASRTTPAT